MIMKDRITHCFNKGAKTYDFSAGVQAKVAKSLAQRLLKFSAQSILEIGCGTGLFSQELQNRYPHASQLLIDISPEMIAQCKKRFNENSFMQFDCMDGENIATPMQFDLIASSMTVHWFSELKKSFENIISRLKPGGRFIFALLGENSLQEWRSHCQQFNYPVATTPLPSFKKLKQDFPVMKIEKELVFQKYNNLRDFLLTLKGIGATTSPSYYVPLSTNKLRKILKHFNHEITMTYEVIYGEYIKV
jgi:malonyl-CoA O-methyltransferase